MLVAADDGPPRLACRPIRKRPGKKTFLGAAMPFQRVFDAPPRQTPVFHGVNECLERHHLQRGPPLLRLLQKAHLLQVERTVDQPVGLSLEVVIGIDRFAEREVDVALDLSGRPYLHYEIDFPGEKILGDPPFDPQLVEEFFRAFITAAGITLHIALVRGKNTHHIIEATFKGVARSLRDAVKVEGHGVPSTKGTL